MYFFVMKYLTRSLICNPEYRKPITFTDKVYLQSGLEAIKNEIHSNRRCWHFGTGNKTRV